MTGVETYEEAIVRLRRGAESERAFGTMDGWGPWTDEARLHARSDEGEVEW